MSEAYQDFINSTGFGVGSNFGKQEKADPLNQPRVTPDTNRDEADAMYKTNYQNANTGPPRPRRVPNTVTGTSLPGAVMPQQGLLPHRYEKPYPESNVLGRQADARAPQGKAKQKSWQAVAVGVEQNDPALKEPASQYESGRSGEKMTGKYDATAERNYMIGAIFFGMMTVGSAAKWAQNKGDKSWMAASAIMGALTGVGIWLYVQEKNKATDAPEGMHGAGTGPRKVLMRDNLPDDTVARQRDQTDVKPYPKLDDPEDSIQSRMKYGGVDTNTLEGPRSGLGYRRSPATADKRQRLKARELMRSAGQYNMDDGTFDEYMARMDGETPNQFYQAQPYMPFSANWNKARGEIDDSNRYFGISDQPGQELRKSIYRDPRMQQGGAKTMHTQDPPPGSVHPLSKVHPWLERDESGMEPPVMMGGGGVSESAIAMETNGERRLSGADAGQFIQDRMREGIALEGQIPKPEKKNPQGEFMAPVRTSIHSNKSERDSNELPVRPLYEPVTGAPDEPIDVKDDPFGEKPRQKMRLITEQPQEEEVQESGNEQPVLHGGSGGVNDDEPDGFMSAFKEKQQPTDQDIKRAELDVRRD